MKKSLILIPLVAVVIYSNVYHCPFIFDDIRIIAENPKIRDLIGYFSLAQFPGPRAVVDITFALNYRFGKLDVFGYHLVNVLIHTINGFLVYFLALTIFRRLTGSLQLSNSSGRSSREEAQSAKSRALNSKLSLMALFAALIFVVHPIQTQAVTYTAQRYASMAAMFYIGAILFYLKARVIQRGSELKTQSSDEKARRKKRKGQKKTPDAMAVPVTEQASRSALRLRSSAYFALSVLCGMLALFSKQNTASLPAAILLAEYLFIDGTWQGWKKKIGWIAPIVVCFVIIVLCISGLTRGGIHFGSLLEDVSGLMEETKAVGRWSYLCTQFNVLIIYLRLLFLPVSQNLDYVYPFKSGFFDGYTPFAFLVLAGLAALGIWLRKSRPIITFAIFWFFITLSVESSIIPIRDAMFEHRLYLPMVGFALLVSCLISNLLSANFHGLPAAAKRENPPLPPFVKGGDYKVPPFVKGGDYEAPPLTKEGDSKAPPLTKGGNYKAPPFIKGRGYKAPPFIKGGMGGFSYKQLLAVIISVSIIISLGTAAYLRNRAWRDEITLWSDVVSNAPLSVRGHNNLGNALALQGKFKEAVGHYSEALRIAPHDVEAHYNMGKILIWQGDLNGAIGHLSEALRLRPGYAEAHNNLGAALALQGKFKEAVGHYSEALRLRPGYAKAHYNMGNALMREGNFEEAAGHFTEALRATPRDAGIHNVLGVALAKAGRAEDAIGHYHEALRINPDFSAACYNIACLYATQNRTEESINWLRKAVEKGYKNRNLLKTDEDLDNIRGAAYYKRLVAGIGK